MFEIKMGITASETSYAAGIDIGLGQHVFNANRFAIKDGKSKREDEKAGLQERRLLRLERALKLKPICDH